MTRKRNNRGSAILVAIGLLVILALLGTSFVIVAMLEARQAEAIADKGGADPLIQGVLNEIRHRLREDLHISSSATADKQRPYTDLAAGPESWRQFVTYPSKEISFFLSTPWFSGIATWPQVCNLYKGPDANFENLAVGNASLVDTDGDGVKDARWVDTGVVNEKGEKYYVAVRVEDLSGLLCLNTGGDKTDSNLPPYVAPVTVDLKTYLQFIGVSYASLHASRGGASTLAQYNADCALRLASPNGAGYLPFSAGDEAFLRYYADSSNAKTGRVYSLMSSATPAQRRILTATTIDRALVRRPVADSDAAKDFTRRVCLTGLDLSVAANRDTLFNGMFRFLDKLGLGSGSGNQREQLAAHFVANFWAYQTAGMTGAPWAYTKGTYTAYGLIPQPVITEAFAKFTQESAPTANDHKWVACVEIFNPTGASIDLTAYTLAGQALTGTLNAGAKKVYWNWHGYTTEDDAKTDAGLGLITGLEKIAVAGFTFYGNGNQTIALARGVVPIDEVSDSDLNFSAGTPADANETKDIRRDDDLGRARYNVAEYKSFAGHALGNANGLAVSDLAASKYPVPILRKGAAVASLGEMERIYFTGPSLLGANKTPFPKALQDGTFTGVFGDAPARGRLDFHPSSAVPAGWGTSGTPEYPDVPAACLLAEFFTCVPPDATRTDEPTRQYGMVNINTAPVDVLKSLPWPAYLDMNGNGSQDGGEPNVVVNDLVNYIVAYSEKTGRYASGRAANTGTNIAGLRSVATPHSDIKGFLAPGELAIPLADYANALLGWSDYAAVPENATLTRDRNYIDGRDSLYRAVANVVTVRSDLFAATILLQLRMDDGSLNGVEKATWRYLAVFDRSNCVQSDNEPAVLMVTQVQ
ncbi:MAG TPA: hypothetical protein DCX07_01800 [Phycisphaerales bacterium]|nr:hypothetical protein [Phycisphaerales bacterium]